MIALDASVLVSALWTADVNHSISRAWLDTQLELGTPLVAPWLLLAEVAGAVTRRTNDTDLGFDAAEYVQALPILVLIDLNALLGQRSAELAITLRLRGADAIYLAVADRMGVPLFTWDREQFERGAGVVSTQRPSLQQPNGS